MTATVRETPGFRLERHAVIIFHIAFDTVLQLYINSDIKLRTTLGCPDFHPDNGQIARKPSRQSHQVPYIKACPGRRELPSSILTSITDNALPMDAL